MKTFNEWWEEYGRTTIARSSISMIAEAAWNASARISASDRDKCPLTTALADIAEEFDIEWDGEPETLPNVIRQTVNAVSDTMSAIRNIRGKK